MSKEPIKDNKSKEQMQTLEPCISHNADETNENTIFVASGQQKSQRKIYFNKSIADGWRQMTFDIDDYRKYLLQLMQSRFWKAAFECGMDSCSNLMIIQFSDVSMAEI